MIRITYFFLGLSILITLHELGHYLAARFFKTRVEKFYLFFDFLFPFPGLLNFTLFKKKIGDTEYGIGWFPFGGYVKIAGMMDESMDEEALKQPPQPDEFRVKPAYQRLIIMLGGIIVNVLLAFFIYAMILLKTGEQSIPMKNATYGFVCDSLAQSIGLKTGDKFIGYDNKKFTDATVPVVKDLLLNNAKVLHIERNGGLLDINIPESVYRQIIEGEGKVSFVKLAFPSELDTIMPESPLFGFAEKGDKVVMLDNQPIQYFAEMGSILQRNKGKEIDVTLQRGEATIGTKITVAEDGLLKVGARNITDYFEIETKEYNLLTCFPAGVKHSWKILQDYVKQFRIIFSPELKGYKQLGGFASISKLYPDEWNWLAFWNSTAFISILLAFMNLLPIPALDGGHALFTIVEMITGRKPSDKFLEYAQIVGMVLLFGLMIYANGNDLVRWLYK
jgi:regulator of sigma E protease